MHRHYAKPMSFRDVIMANLGVTDRKKRNNLMQEGYRRLNNCHPDLPG